MPANLSTGPRTEAGKAVSSMNSLKHGLTSRRIVLLYENQAEYDALLKDLLDESQPVGTLEFELVNDIAACIWRLRRVRHREGDLAEVALGLKASKQAREDFALMMRYTAAIERELHRAIIRLNQVQELRHKRDERRRKDQESKSHRPTATPPRALAVAQSFSPQSLTTESDFVSLLAKPSPNPPPSSAQLATDNGQLTTQQTDR